MTATAAPAGLIGVRTRFGGSTGRLVCPSCRRGLFETEVGLACRSCRSQFPRVLGIPDLRVVADRYLSIEDDRRKTETIHRKGCGTGISKVVRSYYEITEDVDRRRRDLYLAHLERAEIRGESFASLLRGEEHVLEVGCGSGGLLKAAARDGIDIHGVDIALRWLVIARERQPDARLLAANADALPWSNGTFTCVAADSLLEHLDDPIAALREWRRVTRPGGRLVLWSPNRWSILADPHVDLWGLGWLPRRWQAPYVGLRRSCEWPLRIRSATEAAKMARSAGWSDVRVEPAAAPGPGKVFRAYEKARSLPLAASFLRRFGPLWQMTATRGGDG